MKKFIGLLAFVLAAVVLAPTANAQGYRGNHGRHGGQVYRGGHDYRGGYRGGYRGPSNWNRGNYGRDFYYRDNRYYGPRFNYGPGYYSVPRTRYIEVWDPYLGAYVTVRVYWNDGWGCWSYNHRGFTFRF